MRDLKSYSAFLLGYLILPFISFLLSLRHYKKPWFKNALWLFIIFFGFSMSYIESIDSYAYRVMFEEFTYTQRVNSLKDVFDPSKTGNVDFGTSLINYLLTSFTSNYHILFGVYGLIFGYFYSRNIDTLLQLVKSNNAKRSIGLVIFVTFYIGFWNINGFRFWTATHIYIYGVINYILKTKKTKGLLLMVLSLVFHYAFVFPLLIFLIYKYIPKFNRVYLIIIFILTTYNPLDNLNAVAGFLETYTYNEQLARKVEVYTSIETAEKLAGASNRTNIVKIVSNLIIRSFILILAWMLIGKLHKIKKHEMEFFYLGLMITLVASLFSFVPSLGPRFIAVGLLLLLYSITRIILNYNFFRNRRALLSIISLFCCILIVNNEIWILFVFSIHTVIGNYFTVFLDNKDVFYSLGDLLIGTLK